MRRVRFVLFVLGIVLLGATCGENASEPAAEDPIYTPTWPNAEPGIDPYATVLDSFLVEAPSGAQLAGMLRRPDPVLYPELSFAAVIKVAGGINPGRLESRGEEARILAEAGMVVVTFNAEERCDDSGIDVCSGGSEDYNGHRNQDGLAAITDYVLARPYVIATNVGLRTHSYGITMATGCLARHPELNIKYLVDDEGPSRSFVTVHEPYSLDADSTNDKHQTVYEILGHYSTARDTSAANAAFWAEREAVHFIGDFQGYYVRLQAEWDHAQPPATIAEVDSFDLPPIWWRGKHTTEMVNAAVAGGVPWVRVNLPEQGNPIGMTYSQASCPVLIPGTIKDGPAYGARAVLEMARMPSLR